MRLLMLSQHSAGIACGLDKLGSQTMLDALECYHDFRQQIQLITQFHSYRLVETRRTRPDEHSQCS